MVELSSLVASDTVYGCSNFEQFVEKRLVVLVSQLTELLTECEIWTGKDRMIDQVRWYMLVPLEMREGIYWSVYRDRNQMAAYMMSHNYRYGIDWDTDYRTERPTCRLNIWTILLLLTEYRLKMDVPGTIVPKCVCAILDGLSVDFLRSDLASLSYLIKRVRRPYVTMNIGKKHGNKVGYDTITFVNMLKRYEIKGKVVGFVKRQDKRFKIISSGMKLKDVSYTQCVEKLFRRKSRAFDVFTIADEAGTFERRQVLESSVAVMILWSKFSNVYEIVMAPMYTLTRDKKLNPIMISSVMVVEVSETDSATELLHDKLGSYTTCITMTDDKCLGVLLSLSSAPATFTASVTV